MYGFPFKTLESLYAAASRPLPAPGNAAALSREVRGDGFALRNALAIQPMEGCDADESGAPGAWTLRRYRRFAAGGAGLIWAEAVAVSPEARANPRQLMITEENLPAFRRMTEAIRVSAREAGFEPPVTIAQLTHSGRFSRPASEAAPIRAWTNAALDAHQRLPEDYPIISDEALSRLPERFARSAALCREAGFDGVDVKACHLYLLSELLGAKGRPGAYGGAFEGRVKLYLDCLDAARLAFPDGILASRLNLYDGEAGAWGVGEGLELALEEPLKLVKLAREHGVRLLNVTMGTPYFNPHVNRPYATGGYLQPESPAEGVSRLLYGCAQAQKAAPELVTVATGFSYLRAYAPIVAAGLIEAGGAKVAGFGRGAFAYPDFARDILETGAMKPEKCCVACGLCTKIMRAGGRPGCPVRDGEWYLPELRRVTGGEA